MTSSEIAAHRLLQQGLVKPNFSSAQEVVEWLGAMQAQDFWMARWAVGSRCSDVTMSDVVEAFNKGEILRTHLMRPTWHFVSRNDIRWMIELSRPQIMAASKYRHKELSLTPKMISKCLTIIEQLLLDSPSIPRDEVVKTLEKNKISNYDNRASHILAIAELEGLICSGPMKGNDQTYALLDTRAPKAKSLDREISVALLTERYFTSHGPATLDDFINWSGLPQKAARAGLEAVQSKLIEATIGLKKYWFAPHAKSKTSKHAVHLTAAFDEIIIGYKDRSAFIDPKLVAKVISKNGIFWPAILINGKVSGIWKRSFVKGKVVVDFEFFRKHNAEELKTIKQAVKRFEKFCGATKSSC